MSTGNPPDRNNDPISEEGSEDYQLGRAESDLATELEKLIAENAAMKDQLLRALAEAENTRRRVQRDREDFAKYSAAPLAKDILPVADNLARALAAVPKEALASDEALKNLVEGIAATERQLQSALERHSIKRIDPEGEKFDSHRHQAMFEVPDASVPAGSIVQVVQPGYMIGDRVLRPALVGVSKGGPKAAPNPSSNDNAKAAQDS